MDFDIRDSHDSVVVAVRVVEGDDRSRIAEHDQHPRVALPAFVSLLADLAHMADRRGCSVDSNRAESPSATGDVRL